MLNRTHNPIPLRLRAFLPVGLLWILCGVAELHAQSLWTAAPSSDEYPSLSIPVIAFDADGRVVVEPSAADFSITENELGRPVQNLECHSFVVPSLSSVLMIDVSESMREHYLPIAQTAAKTWLDMLDLEISECALATFNDQNKIHTDFTQSRQTLEHALDALQAGGNTDFNAAFTLPKTGALDIAASGQFAPLVIIVTDGDAGGNQADILARLRDSGIRVYSLLLGIDVPPLLQNVANASDGLSFANIRTAAEARAAFAQIFLDAAGVEPCRLQWTSPDDCSVNKTANISYMNSVAKAVNYSVPPEQQPHLNVKPGLQDIGAIAPGTSQQFTFTISNNATRKKPVEITDVKVNNTSISVVDFGGAAPPFVLVAGEERTITCNFSALDLQRRFLELEIVSSSCRTAQTTVVVGSADQETLGANVRVRHPNGGEVFKLGEDVEIAWDGNAAHASNSIELSPDGGASWQEIGKTDGVNTFSWQATEPLANQWLARLSVLAQPGPEQTWAWSSQSTAAAHIHDITVDSEGRIFLAASFDGDIDFGDGLQLNTALSRAMFLAVFSPLGRPLYARVLDANPGVHPMSLALTSEGSLYLLASFKGEFSDGENSVNSQGQEDIVLGHFSAELSSISIKTFGGPGADIAGDLRVIDNDELIVVGSLSVGFNGLQQPVKLRGSDAAFIMRLDASAEVKWLKTVDGEGLSNAVQDVFYGVEQVKDRLIAVGAVSNGAFFNDQQIEHGGAGPDALVATFDLNGAEVHATTFQAASAVSARDVIVDAAEDIVICGQFSGKNFSGLGISLESAGIQNSFLLSLATDLSVNWGKALGEVTARLPHLAYRASTDEIILSLAYTRQLNIDEQQLIDGGGAAGGVFGDIALLRFNSAGKLHAAQSYGGIKIDQGTALTVAPSGAVIMGGRFEGDMRLGDIEVQAAGRQSVFLWHAAEGTVIAQDVSDAAWTVAQAEFSVNAADLGNCDLGRTCEKSFAGLLHNPGDIDVMLDVAEFEGTDAAAFELVSPSLPLTLVAGGSAAVELRFRPLHSGAHAADLTVLNLEDGQSRTAGLTGFARPQVLTLPNTVVDFGDVQLGQTKQLREVVVHNLRTGHSRPHTGRSRFPAVWIRTTRPAADACGGGVAGAGFVVPADDCGTGFRLNSCNDGRGDG